MNVSRTAPSLLSELLCHGRGSDPALISAGSFVSYGELRDAVEGLAGSLRELGAARGDRTAVILTNGPSFATSLLAIWRAGGVAVPVDPRIPAGQAARIIRDCEAKGVLCDGHVLSNLAPAIPCLDVTRDHDVQFLPGVHTH